MLLIDSLIGVIMKVTFYELKIVEDFSDLDPDSITDEVVEIGEDTMTLLDRYVEEIESQAINKNKLKRIVEKFIC